MDHPTSKAKKLQGQKSSVKGQSLAGRAILLSPLKNDRKKPHPCKKRKDGAPKFKGEEYFKSKDEEYFKDKEKLRRRRVRQSATLQNWATGKKA
jgi:hypothetical protein